MSTLRRHPTAWFFVFAWLFSWVFMIPLALAKHGFMPPVPMWLHYFSAYGPLLSALLMSYVTAGAVGVKAWWGRIKLWRARRWVWVITLSPMIAMVGAVIVQRISNGDWFDFTTLGTLNFLPDIGWWALGLWLLNSGLGEEAGWRGYALPSLVQRFSPRNASLIIAAGWMTWHIPALSYLPSYTHFSVGMGIGFFLGILSGAFLLTWISIRSSNSMLLPIIWHGLFNFLTAPPASGKLIAPVVSTLMMVIGFSVIFVLRKQPTRLEPPPT